MRAIFTFHSVDDAGDVLSYSPEFFEHLLDALAKKRIPVVSLDQLLADEQKPGVALTFDDGMQSVWANALPIMQAFDVTATVYVSSDLIGGSDLWPRQPGVGQYAMMSWDNVSAMHSAGMQIEAHTASHPDMRSLSVEQIADECQRSDQRIHECTGRWPVHFAYPFGYHNRTVRELVAKHYRSAVTTHLAYAHQIPDLSAIPRIDTYYLQSHWMIDRLDTRALRLWLCSRSIARSLRGSQ